MAARKLPTQFPAIVTREVKDLDEANRNIQTLVRAIEELRRQFIVAINDHATIIDDHETRITALEP